MITRRTFWKKTVGVAAAAIAVVCGESVVKAAFPEYLETSPIEMRINRKVGDVYNLFGIRLRVVEVTKEYHFAVPDTCEDYHSICGSLAYPSFFRGRFLQLNMKEEDFQYPPSEHFRLKEGVLPLENSYSIL